jgi:hypothetical protein
LTTENDFLPFAAAGGANVITQSAYVAATTLVANGFQSGLAQSEQINKVMRQSSIMAAVIADFIVAQTGQPAIDDGTTATLLANFIAATSGNALGMGQTWQAVTRTAGMPYTSPGRSIAISVGYAGEVVDGGSAQCQLTVGGVVVDYQESFSTGGGAAIAKVQATIPPNTVYSFTGAGTGGQAFCVELR